jgi:hypothetical protein
MPSYTRQKGDEVLIYKQIDYVQQQKKMSCWYACAEMLFKYRRPNQDFEEFLKGTPDGRKMLALYESGLSIESDDKSLEGNLERWAVLTEAMGMRELKPLPDSPEKLAMDIMDHGPLWCAGKFFQGCESDVGHIVTVLGVFKRKAAFGPGLKAYVIFHDPAPKKFNGEAGCFKMWDAWFAKRLYSPHVTNGESPMMYLPEMPRNWEPQPYRGLGVGQRESVRA